MFFENLKYKNLKLKGKEHRTSENNGEGDVD